MEGSGKHVEHLAFQQVVDSTKAMVLREDGFFSRCCYRQTVDCQLVPTAQNWQGTWSTHLVCPIWPPLGQSWSGKGLVPPVGASSWPHCVPTVSPAACLRKSAECASGENRAKSEHMNLTGRDMGFQFQFQTFKLTSTGIPHLSVSEGSMTTKNTEVCYHHAATLPILQTILFQDKSSYRSDFQTRRLHKQLVAL